MKTAILCSAFGSARIESIGIYTSILDRLKNRFSIETSCWAFTSSVARRRLGESGVIIESPEIAVNRLLETNDRVIVQPFQIVAGGEYEKAVAEISSAAGRGRIFFGDPLIRNEEDCRIVAELMITRKDHLFPDREGVIVAGHGNGNHWSDHFYQQLNQILSDRNRMYRCATLEAEPTIDQTIDCLTQTGCRSAVILPLLFSTGKHVAHDIGGDDSASWKGLMNDAGIDTTVDLSGIGAVEPFVQIWLDRIGELF